MAAPDGSIIIDTRINANGARRGVQEVQSAMGRLAGTVKKIGTVIFTAFAIKQLINFGKECTKLGSDLEEVENVVSVTFPRMTEKVNEFALAAADAFGLSETMAKKYVGTFGAMAKSFGYSEEAAYDMSTALTGLTGDVASFYNLSQEEAYTKLKSVFTGETETLKELGVVMTQNALDQYALANGYGKTTAKMTEQEKVALRLRFVQEQLSAASGDFARTSDSWANQVRIMQLRLESLKATIGQGLINIFTPVIKAINVFLAKLSVAANAFKDFTELLMGKQSSGNGKNSEAANTLNSIQSGYEGAAEGAEDFADGTKDATKQAKKLLAPFDEIIKLQDKAEENDSATNEGTGGIILPPELSGENNSLESPFLNNVISLLDKIKDRLLELKGILESGFWDGLGDYKPLLENLKLDLSKIGGYFRNIFTDADVMAAAKRFVDSFVYAVGSFLGVLVSVGMTIASNIVGGIESYLSRNIERIKAWIVRMFDVGTEINIIFSNFFAAFSDVFSVFASDTAKEITSYIIQIFADVFGGILELTLKFVRDVLDIILTPFVENKEKIKEAMMNTLEPILVVVKSIAETVRMYIDKIVKLYDDHIHPFLTNIKNGLSEIFSHLLDGYNKYISPVLDKLADKFQEVMKGPVGDAIDSAITFMGKLFDAVNLLWTNILKPFIVWLVDTIMPIAAPIIEAFGMAFLGSFGDIANAVSIAFDILSGLLDFIVGIFSGDWEKAWSGIESIFGIYWDMMEELVTNVTKTIHQKIVSFVNDVLHSIHELESKLPGVIDLIDGLLSRNWKKSWNGMKSIFDTIWKHMKTTALDVINSILDKINKLIESVRSAAKSVSNFFKGTDNSGSSGGGGRPFSLERSYTPAAAYMATPYRMPRLATGTVVPPRAGEFAAILGDNKRETEVVSPLSTMKQAMLEALQEAGIGGENKTAGPIYMEIDGKVFARMINPYMESEKSRIGVRMVNT